jgi:tRNA-2-methylthio-N6-dimethylallyladenosine synthase
MKGTWYRSQADNANAPTNITNLVNFDLRTPAIVPPGDIISDMRYHIWTEGCQMNVADSQHIAAALERLGYEPAQRPESADVIVLNTCVVRQSAEDKAYGRLYSLRPIKQKRPSVVINLMGCLVGVRGSEHLRKKLPFVDIFSPPSDPGPLLAYLTQGESRSLEQEQTQARYATMDDELVLPLAERGKLVSAFVPVCWDAHMPVVIV